MSNPNVAESQRWLPSSRLSQNEQVKFFLCKMNPRWQNPRWLYPTWQNSRWLFKPSSIWVRMHEWSFFVQNDWIQDGRIQDGCHHQFEWEWMSLKIELVWNSVQNGWIQDGRIQDGCHHQVSQIELVWDRVRMEGECFWVNLREDNKSVWIQQWLNPRWQNSRWLPSSSWVRMKFESDWISLSQSQNVNPIWQSVFHQVESEWMIESKIESVDWIQDGRIQDGCHHQVESEWFRVRGSSFCAKWLNPRWQCLNPTWQSSRWLPSSSWVRMNKWSFFLCK